MLGISQKLRRVFSSPLLFFFWSYNDRTNLKDESPRRAKNVFNRIQFSGGLVVKHTIASDSTWWWTSSNLSPGTLLFSHSNRIMRNCEDTDEARVINSTADDRDCCACNAFSGKEIFRYDILSHQMRWSILRVSYHDYCLYSEHQAQEFSINRFCPFWSAVEQFHMLWTVFRSQSVCLTMVCHQHNIGSHAHDLAW